MKVIWWILKKADASEEQRASLKSCQNYLLPAPPVIITVASKALWQSHEYKCQPTAFKWSSLMGWQMTPWWVPNSEKKTIKASKKVAAAVLEKYRNSFCKFAKLAKAFNRDIVDRKCQTIIFLALPKKIGCFYALVTFTTRKNIFSLKEGFHGDLNPFDFFFYWHLWRWKKMWLIFLWFNDLVVETGNAAGLKTPHLIPANKGRNVPLLDLFLWVLGNFWLFVWWLGSSNPTWIKMKKYLRVPIFGGNPDKYLGTLAQNLSFNPKI